MKRLLIPLWVAGLIFVSVFAERVFNTFDPSLDSLTQPLNLKFDTNSVVADNFFSPRLLFSADGSRCFVNFPGSDSVLVFDPATMAAIATLPVGRNPALLAMTPDQRTIVVANVHLADKIPVNKQIGSLSFIDIQTLSVQTVSLTKVDLSLGSNIVFTPDGSTGYVASTGTDEIVRFRVQERAEVPPRLKLPGGSRPVGLTMAHNGSFFTVINVADQQFSTIDDSISIVNTGTFQVRTTILPKEAHDFVGTHNIALTQDDRKGIIGDHAGGGAELDVAYIFDTGSGEILKRVALGTETNFTAVTPDNSRFVVVDLFGVSVLSTDTYEVLADLRPVLAGFSRAANVAFTADSSTAYVASVAEDLVYGIDLRTYGMPVTVAVGKDPATVADGPLVVTLSPDEKRLTVLNFGSNTIDFVGKTFAFAIPRFYSTGLRLTGIILDNVGTEPANVRLTARSGFGTPLTDSPVTTGRVELINPGVVDLAPGQQVGDTSTAFFLNDLSLDPIDGWISGDSTQRDVIGSFEIGDYSGRKLNGANFNRPALSFTFPVVRQNDEFSTELVVANPNANDASVTVDLFDSAGTKLASAPLGVSGDGFISRKLKSDDVAAVADLFTQAVGLEGGYMALTSTIPVHALTIYESATGLSVLPGIERTAVDVAAGEQLVAPEVRLQGGFRTVVSLVNSTGQDAYILLNLFGNDGRALAAPQPVSLANTQAVAFDLAELFGLTGSVPLSGWLQVASTSAGIAASADIFAFDGLAISSYPLVVNSGTDFHFAHLAPDGGYSTTLALVNPGPGTALVAVDVYGNGSEPVASRQFTLEPGGRVSGLLDAIAGPSAGAGVRIRVRSTIPLAGLEFFGNPDLETLSVVLPQSLQ